MHGTDFISLAGKLAVLPAADEATYRTAVSRAYYGAFHAAYSFLQSLGFTLPANSNVHGFVRQYLFGSNHPDACRAASQLGDLQAARNRADYELDDPHAGTRGYAIIVVERAHIVVSALDSCKNEPARETIRVGIGNYLSQIRPR